MELADRRLRKVCLTCGKNLNLFQWLARRRFCSDEHKREYFGQINHIALLRLRDAQDPLTRDTSQR
jgi:hypothetical protein